MIPKFQYSEIVKSKNWKIKKNYSKFLDENFSITQKLQKI